MRVRADNYEAVGELVKRCRDEDDIDKRIEMLNQINSILPQPKRIKLPSLLTHDYIGTALDRIEEYYRWRPFLRSKRYNSFDNCQTPMNSIFY
jgi:hypothetical protein